MISRIDTRKMMLVAALVVAYAVLSGCAFLTTRQQQAVADSQATIYEAALAQEQGVSGKDTAAAIKASALATAHLVKAKLPHEKDGEK